jgi:hypothetical protein
MKTLPTSVTSILDDLGQSHLAGDLTEELQAGRSCLWVWWQVAAALLRGVRTAVRTNRYLALRAVAVGWIALQVLNGHFPFSPHPGIGAWVQQSGFWVVLIAMPYLIAGWVVARLHPQHRSAMVLASAAVLILLNAAAGTER